jgi:hypothetical protein
LRRASVYFLEHGIEPEITVHDFEKIILITKKSR